MKKILQAIRDFIADRFNLNEDRADEQQIIEAIRKDVNFKGTNLWTLIFAIFKRIQSDTIKILVEY